MTLWTNDTTINCDNHLKISETVKATRLIVMNDEATRLIEMHDKV